MMIHEALLVEFADYLGSRFEFYNKLVKNIPDQLHLVRRPRLKDDAIGLQILALSALQDAFGISMLIDQLSSQSKTWCPALPEAQLDLATMGRKYLDRQFPTEFARHPSLEGFCDIRHEAAVVLKFFGTVLNPHTGFLADEFIVRAFVRILESAPPAYVVDEDKVEVRAAKNHVANEVFQGLAAI